MQKVKKNHKKDEIRSVEAKHGESESEIQRGCEKRDTLAKRDLVVLENRVVQDLRIKCRRPEGTDKLSQIKARHQILQCPRGKWKY